MNAPAPAPLWITFALSNEAAYVEPRDARIVLTGMGAANTQRALEEALTEERPARILNCGFAGALNPALRLGTIVYDVDDTFPGAEEVRRTSAYPARFFEVDRMLVRAWEKSTLWEEGKGDVVDMESRAVRRICQEQGIACAVVRVISDEAGEDLPLDFNQLLTRRRTIHYGALALALARRPGRIPALLRLHRQTREAALRLAAALAEMGFARPVDPARLS